MARRLRGRMEMKKRTVSVAAAVVLTTLTLAGTALAGADVSRERVVIDPAGMIEDGCDEPILLTEGHVVETIQEFVDPNGRTHFLLHVQTFGLRGVGLDSGAIYRDRTHFTQVFVAEIAEGFSTGAFSLRIRISSTEADTATLVVSHRFHLVKRDGVNRLVIDDFTVTCG
jgi:hypothetical protein